MLTPPPSSAETLYRWAIHGNYGEFNTLKIVILPLVTAFMAAGYSVEVFLRHGFGERYIRMWVFLFGSFAILLIGIVKRLLFELFGSEGVGEIFVVSLTNNISIVLFMIVALSVGAGHHVLARNRRLSGKEHLYTVHPGESWMIASLKSKITPQRFMMLKHLFEPGIVFIFVSILWALLFFSGVGGYRLWGYLMVASACLFVKGLMIVNYERHKTLNTLDAQTHLGNRPNSDGYPHHATAPGQANSDGEFIATIDPKLWERQRK